MSPFICFKLNLILLSMFCIKYVFFFFFLFCFSVNDTVCFYLLIWNNKVFTPSMLQYVHQVGSF